jgi:DNA invertase Pin-like site-specific DNA recombinase
MTKAYSYLRMSTNHQLKGDSLRRQRELSESYAAKNGLELIDSIEDIGVSAFRGKNAREGALGTFLDLVEIGSIEVGSYLLVESLDRLSRDKVLNAFGLFTDILSKGIIIVTLQDGQKYTEEDVNQNPGQLFLSLGVMLRAHDESQTKSSRLSASWKNKRDNPKKRILTSICPNWLEAREDKSGFVEIPDAVKIVRTIYDWSLNGDGQMAIARRLNEQGVPSIGRAKQWNISYVKKILKSEAVFGTYQPHRMVSGKRTPIGNSITDYFPEIVSKADFLRVQDGLSRRTGRGGRKGKFYSNLFAHIAICGACGSSMNYINKGQRSLPKLICRSAHQKSGCASMPWTYTDFEGSFIASVASLNLEQIFDKDITRVEKELADSIVILQEKIDIQKQLYFENIQKWTKLDPSIQDDLAKQLVADKDEIEINENELSAASKQYDERQRTHMEAAKYSVLRLSDKMSEATSDEEIYILRSSVAGQISNLVSTIRIFTNMHINPWEVDLKSEDGLLSKQFVEVLSGMGYQTEREIELLFETKHGQRLYNKFERYISIEFKNGKSAWLQPSTSLYLEFDRPRIRRLGS